MSNNHISFELKLKDDLSELEFFNGEICFSAYSYYLDLYGQGSLSKDQTKELYEVMKNYYEG